MIALLQRVISATVVVDDATVAQIDKGILALIGIEKDDGQKQIADLARRMLHYRIFPDPRNRMNLNLQQAAGTLLLVPNFTLAADTRRGLRPGFETAAKPAIAEKLFQQLVDSCLQQYASVQSGIFGADMQIKLTNDGPVTFLLGSSDAKPGLQPG